MSEVISKPTGVRQIARQLSLSICTVSKALNQRPGVSEKTRQRVMSVATDLGYVPNQQAKMLSNGRTRTIALLLPTLANPVYSERMEDIYQAAEERGFDVLVTSYEWNRERRESLCREMIGRRVEGVIVHGGPLSLPLEMLQNAGISVLCLNPADEMAPGVSVLKVDRARSAGLLLRHLLDWGHRRPLLVGNWHHKDMRRIEGICKALAEAGRPADEFITGGDFLDRQYMRRGYEQALEIFRSDRRAATAVMAHNDQAAMGVIAALHQLGLAIPGDVSVTGMDNIAAAEYTVPPLTTDSITHLDLGRHAIEMLVGMIAGEIPPGAVKTLSPRLVVRQSTGPAMPSRSSSSVTSFQERSLSCSR